jgi:outer membrane protein
MTLTRIGVVAVLALAALPLFASRVADAQSMKVAVVDAQRAIHETADGKRATALLKKLFDGRQQELSRKEQELMKRREELDRQSRQLSQAALQKQLETWQEQMLELQSTYVEYDKEPQKKQRELLVPVQEKVTAAIRELAMRGSYDLVVDKATAAFVRTDLDLTDQVIQRANAAAAAPATTATTTAPPPH